MNGTRKTQGNIPRPSVPTTTSTAPTTFAGRPILPSQIHTIERIRDPHALPIDFPFQMWREIGPPQTREDPVRALDKVFTTYGERLRSEMQDLRGLCAKLVVQEKQESAKWYALCAKVIMERDYARQKLNMPLTMTTSGGALALALPASSPSPIPGTCAPARVEPSRNVVDRGRASSKRSRDAFSDVEEIPMMKAGTTSTPSRSSSRSISPTDSVTRPIKPLRLSPIHSPTTSPPPMSPSPSSSPSLAPPLSGMTLTSPSSGVSSSSPLLSSSCPPDSQQQQQQQRPVKRRKPCEADCGPTVDEIRPSFHTAINPAGASLRGELATRSSPPVKIKQESPTPLSLTSGAGDGLNPTEFSHVDLMYASIKGSFICRACLLEKSKSPSSSREPKTYPINASWDELRDHCVKLHPSACADVARLCPAEIFELRRRLSL